MTPLALCPTPKALLWGLSEPCRLHRASPKLPMGTPTISTLNRGMTGRRGPRTGDVWMVTPGVFPVKAAAGNPALPLTPVREFPSGNEAYLLPDRRERMWGLRFCSILLVKLPLLAGLPQRVGAERGQGAPSSTVCRICTLRTPTDELVPKPAFLSLMQHTLICTHIWRPPHPTLVAPNVTVLMLIFSFFAVN